MQRFWQFLQDYNVVQEFQLTVVTVTAILALYVSFTTVGWFRRMKGTKTDLRPFIFSLSLAKFNLAFSSCLAIANVVVLSITPSFLTVISSVCWLVVVIIQTITMVVYRPNPDLPDNARTADGRVILVVDDNNAITRAFRRMLIKAGFNAEIAGSGAEALTIIGYEMPCLMIVDLGLPDMNGAELVRRARAIGYNGTAIAISGATDLVDRSKLTSFVELVSKNEIGADALAKLAHQYCLKAV